MSRIYNFSAGPAVLPVEILEQAKEQMLDYNGSGMSVMEMSHRGKVYSAIQDEAKANLRELMNLTDDYEVLFIQATGALKLSSRLVLSEMLMLSQIARRTFQPACLTTTS